MEQYGQMCVLTEHIFKKCIAIFELLRKSVRAKTPSGKNEIENRNSKIEHNFETITKTLLIKSKSNIENFFETLPNSNCSPRGPKHN